VTGAGELTYTVNPRLDLNLSYHRSVDTSLVQGVDYTLDEAFDLSANYRLSPRISASLGARTQKRQYQGVQVPSAVIISHDETKTVFGSVSLKVGLKSELALDARYEERNANPTLFSYTGYRVGLTASTHF
jgi:predicted porin